MNRFHRAYYQAFLLSVIICWAPFKPLAYLAPVLVLAWYIHATKSRATTRRCIWWLLGWLSFILLHAFFYPGFNWTAGLLAILTYGTFAVMFAVPNREIGSRILLARMLRVIALVLLLESAWGVMQATYGAIHTGSFDFANGDRVQGTIHPEFQPDFAAANQMFAVNISLALLALFPVVVVSRKWRNRFLLGAVALVLASVMHVLIFLAVALTASILLYKPPLLPARRKVFVLTALCAVPLLALFLLRTNFATFVPIVKQAMAEASPRAVVTVESITHLPESHPSMLVWGLGPGQFSSRAALIASGFYIGGPYNPKAVPLISPQSSKAFQDYIERWLFVVNPYWGSSQMPFFSWLSVYAEMGVPVMIAILCVAAVVLKRIKQKAKTGQELLFATAVGAAVIFFLLLGIQDNYWEFPQAVLVGVIAMKAIYATFFFGGERDGQGGKIETEPASAA